MARKLPGKRRTLRDRPDAVQVRLEGRNAPLVPLLQVNEARIKVANFPFDGRKAVPDSRPGELEYHFLDKRVVSFPHERPGTDLNPVGRDRGAVDPRAVDIFVEVVTRSDLRVHCGDIESPGPEQVHVAAIGLHTRVLDAASGHQQGRRQKHRTKRRAARHAVSCHGTSPVSFSYLRDTARRRSQSCLEREHVGTPDAREHVCKLSEFSRLRLSGEVVDHESGTEALIEFVADGRIVGQHGIRSREFE